MHREIGFWLGVALVAVAAVAIVKFVGTRWHLAGFSTLAASL